MCPPPPHDLAPPGPVVQIASGDQRATVTCSGATLRTYDVAGIAVVEPFDGPEALAVGCQGEVLAPWPNRVVDGRWWWHGTPQQLAITEPERGHALHGLVRNLTWSVTEHRDDAVHMEVLLLAHDGWPFPLHVSVVYRLGANGLTSVLTATNAGREACPYGAATHPYLALRGAAVDDVVLHLPAATWLETDDRLAPVGRRPTTGTPYDFGDGTPIGGRRADTAFTDLPRAPNGQVQASLTMPDGHTTTMWGDGTVRWWQLFTGDALAPPWTRRALALEPMTCAPDALNSGDDLLVLESGGSHAMTWGIAFERGRTAAAAL